MSKQKITNPKTTKGNVKNYGFLPKDGGLFKLI